MDAATVSKVVSVFVLYALQFLFGILPCFVVRRLMRNVDNTARFQKYVSVMNCFAGGVFFATLLNLLPEAREQVTKTLELLDIPTSYPVSQFLLGIGFFVVVLVEHTVGVCYARGSHSNCHVNVIEAGHMACCNTLSYDVNNAKGNDVTVKTGMLPQQDKNMREKSLETTKQSHAMVDQTSYDSTQDKTSKSLKNENSLEPRFSSGGKTTSEGLDLGGHNQGGNTLEKTEAPSSSSGEGTGFRNQRLRSVMLLIGISLHMVFEGLALGLQKTEGKVWAILVALCIHKAVVFFSIGLHLEKTISALKHILLSMALCSLVSPVGVAIGIGVTNIDDDLGKEIASAVLQSIAAGTFFYVTFFEILQRDLCRKPSLLNVFVTVVGFVLLACVKFVPKKEFG